MQIEKSQTLRKRFNKQFSQICKKNTVLEGFLVLSLDVGTIILAVVAANYASQFVTAVSWSAFGLAVVVIGTRLRSFGNIIHECAHSGFVDSRSWNDRFGRFLSVLLCYSYDCYKHGHMTHHLYTGDYDKDLDFTDTKTYEFHEPITTAQIKRHALRLLTFQFVPFYTGKTMYSAEDGVFWRCLRFSYVAFILTCFGAWWLGSDFGKGVILYWVLPFITVLPAIGYLSDLMDHAGLIANENEIDKSRNYPVRNRFLHWLFFPRHDSYHLVHHLFPTVPTRDLARCHAILMAGSSYYASRPHTLKDWAFSSTFTNPPLAKG